MVTGKSGAGSTDELGARHPRPSRFISLGRAAHRPQVSEPQVLLSPPLQRDATVRER